MVAHDSLSLDWPEGDVILMKGDGGEAASTGLQFVVFGRLPWDGVWLNRHYLSRELAISEPVVYLLDPVPANPFRRSREGSGGPSWDLPGGEGHGSIHVLRPAELPLQRNSVLKKWTDRLVVKEIQRFLDPALKTVTISFPRAQMPAARLKNQVARVYFCPDDFRFNRDGSTDMAFCEWEETELEKCDLVITVTEPLLRRLSGQHRRVRLVENGFDPVLFRPGPWPTPEELKNLPRPLIGFVGTVRPPLIDLGLVSRVAMRRPAWTICLVGWFDSDDPAIARVRKQPNVRVLGPQPREALAGYIEAMDVMTCPYEECALTAPALPLKAWESMGVGRPLVGMHAPLLDLYRPHLRNAMDEDGFIAEVERVLADPPKGTADAATQFTWKRRAIDLRRHIREYLASAT